MAIEFRCPACDRQFRLADNLAGKKGRCPSCKGIIYVPTASDVADVAIDAPVLSRQADVQPNVFEPLSPAVVGSIGDVLLSIPIPSTPEISPVTPMNGVGLVSLFCGLASQLLSVPTIFALISFASHKYRVRTPFDSAVVPCFVLGLLFGFLGLLISRLGQQSIVRKYSLIGLRLALIPVVIFLSHFAYLSIQPNYFASGHKALESGNFEKAEKDYRAALEETRRSDEDHMRAYALSGLASALSGQNRFEEALSFHEKAVAEADSTGGDNQDMIMLILEKQISTCLAAKEYSKAADAMWRHVAIEEETTGKFLVPWQSYLLLSNIHMIKDDFPTAMRSVIIAMEQLEQKGWTKTIPYAACLEQRVIVGRKFGKVSKLTQAEMLDQAKEIRRNFPDLPLPDIQVNR